MSNFKFLCPLCGQKILGSSNYSGTQISCPTCNQTISVPAPGASAQPAAPHSGASTIPLPGLAPSRPVPRRLSRLAVAALVCSVIPPVGIVCGHLALARIRKNIALKGAGIARAGLIIGYIVLVICIVCVVVKTVFRPG